jgi:hypothetical protein
MVNALLTRISIRTQDRERIIAISFGLLPGLSYSEMQIMEASRSSHLTMENCHI